MAKNQVVSATELKAKCLSLLDDIEQTGAKITVTRRGQPIAVFGPIKKNARKSLGGSMEGKIHVHGDIVNSRYAETWDIAKHKQTVSE